MKKTFFVLLVILISLIGCKPEVRIVEVEKPVLVEKEVVVEAEKQVVVEKEVYVEAPPPPAEIVIALPEEPPHLDITDCGCAFNFNICSNIYEGLTALSPDGKLKPALAIKWERVEPGVWRFELRKGVKFHNGVPFNAEIAAWNYNWQLDPDSGFMVSAKYPGGQVEATAVDEYVLEIRLPEEAPMFPYENILMGEPNAIADDPTHQNPVGTGPYILDGWRHGEKIELVANPEWWGGKLDFQKATFVFRSEPAVRAAMQAAREVDIAAYLTPQDAGPIRTLGTAIAEAMFMYFDPTPPLDDVRVRKAICMAMDRDAIANSIFGGYATPANELCPPFVLGYNPDIPVFAYDPEGAKVLLAEAEADGIPIDTEITIFGRYGIYPHSTETMEALQQWMMDIGLNVKLQMLEVGAWREVNLTFPVPEDRVGLTQSCGSAQYDGLGPLQGYYWCGEPGGYKEGCEGRGEFGSRRPILDGKYVEMIDVARTLALDEGREQAIQEAYAYVHEYLWACPMGWLHDLTGVSERIDWTPRFDMYILLREMKLR